MENKTEAIEQMFVSDQKLTQLKQWYESETLAIRSSSDYYNELKNEFTSKPFRHLQTACSTNAECTTTGASLCVDSDALTCGGKVCDSCAADADCTHVGSTNKCSSGTCVECLSDGDCAGGTPECVSNTCRTCDSFTDDGCTGATPYCDSSFNCIECNTNADCSPASPFCNAGGCGPCTTNSQCD